MSRWMRAEKKTGFPIRACGCVVEYACVCVTWNVFVRDMIRVCAWHDTCLCVTWYVCTWHDTCVCVTWNVFVRDMISECVTWYVCSQRVRTSEEYGQVSILRAHSWIASEYGYVTLLWKLQVFTAFHRENASASPFFAKVKSFSEKLRFSFGDYLNYYLQHLSFDVPAVISRANFYGETSAAVRVLLLLLNAGLCFDMCSVCWVQPLFFVRVWGK